MLREKITISLSMIEIDQMKPKIENWRETIERILMIRKFKEKSALSLMASKDLSYMMITGCLLIGHHCHMMIFILFMIVITLKIFMIIIIRWSSIIGLGLDFPALHWIQVSNWPDNWLVSN